MKNGLYKASFRTVVGQGTGVIVINDGLIKGGDSMMYYVGNFKEDANGAATGALHIGKHSDFPGMQSVFNTNDLNLNFSGTSTNTSATIHGFAEEAPTVPFDAQLTLIE